MRNWNSSTSFSGQSACLRFYSTYEELKPRYGFLHLSNASRFYSTYEELKPKLNFATFSHYIKFLQYLWGIETY